MKVAALLLSAAFAPTILFTSCSTNKAAAIPGALNSPRNWQILAKADASGDVRVRAAIEQQLLKRGLIGGNSSGRVEFEDTWRWDVVMYLGSLHLRFYDRDNRLVATGSFRQTGLHVYPSPESAVAKAFDGLAAGGAFSK
jgi:hypothetical protein